MVFQQYRSDKYKYLRANLANLTRTYLVLYRISNRKSLHGRLGKRYLHNPLVFCHKSNCRFLRDNAGIIEDSHLARHYIDNHKFLSDMLGNQEYTYFCRSYIHIRKYCSCNLE
jgi:hypothetical protein